MQGPNGREETVWSTRRAAILSTALFAAIFLFATVPRVVVSPFENSKVQVSPADGIRIDGRSLIASERGPAALNADSFRSGPFILELHITPHAKAFGAIATIVSFSTTTHFNWSVEQHGDSLAILYKNRGLRFQHVLESDKKQRFLVEFSDEFGSLITTSPRVGSV